MAPGEGSRDGGDERRDGECAAGIQNVVQVGAGEVDEFRQRESYAHKREPDRTVPAARHGFARDDDGHGDGEARRDAPARRQPAALVDVAYGPGRPEEEQQRRRAHELHRRHGELPRNPARTPCLANA